MNLLEQWALYGGRAELPLPKGHQLHLRSALQFAPRRKKHGGGESCVAAGAGSPRCGHKHCCPDGHASKRVSSAQAIIGGKI